MQVNSWPSSDPLVTSIGGTQMVLDDAGNRLSPDVVWNDGFGAGGGGVSHVFPRPDFQNQDSSVVGDARGTPDISLNAAVDGGVWVYYTFVTPASPFHIFGGTSAATPEFSGIVAMADQVAGQSLGDINKALYSIPYGGGLVDVTSGNNDIGEFTNSDGNTYHVPGFDALAGYDLASGLGTVDPARFVPALAQRAAGRATWLHRRAQLRKRHRRPARPARRVVHAHRLGGRRRRHGQPRRHADAERRHDQRQPASARRSRVDRPGRLGRAVDRRPERRSRERARRYVDRRLRQQNQRQPQRAQQQRSIDHRCLRRLPGRELRVGQRPGSEQQGRRLVSVRDDHRQHDRPEPRLSEERACADRQRQHRRRQQKRPVRRLLSRT